MAVSGIDATDAVVGRQAGRPLPWLLAAPLIGGMSLGLWLGIWRVAQIVLAG